MKNWIKTEGGSYKNLAFARELYYLDGKVYAQLSDDGSIRNYAVKEFDNDKDAQDYLDDLMRDDDYETFISSEDFCDTKSKLVQLASNIAIDPDKVVGVEIDGYEAFFVAVNCEGDNNYTVGNFTDYAEAVKEFKRVVNLINNH